MAKKSKNKGPKADLKRRLALFPERIYIEREAADTGQFLGYDRESAFLDNLSEGEVIDVAVYERVMVGMVKSETLVTLMPAPVKKKEKGGGR